MMPSRPSTTSNRDPETDEETLHDSSGTGARSESSPRALFTSPTCTALQVPPLNFAMVMPGIYRSGYFNTRNYGFMESCLGLRSLLNLSDDYTKHKIGVENLSWAHSRGMNVYTIKLDAFKEPFGFTPENVVARALSIMLDVRNHPILVHDDKGKHRAGVLIGCLRKLQGYSLASIFHEYASFTHGSMRLLDMQYVELFEHPIPCASAFLPDWLELERDVRE
jgi:tyrosine-protein phosphatase SIW14